MKNIKYIVVGMVIGMLIAGANAVLLSITKEIDSSDVTFLTEKSKTSIDAWAENAIDKQIETEIKESYLLPFRWQTNECLLNATKLKSCYSALKGVVGDMPTTTSTTSTTSSTTSTTIKPTTTTLGVCHWDDKTESCVGSCGEKDTICVEKDVGVCECRLDTFEIGL